MPAGERTAQGEEGQMNRRSPLIAHRQATVAAQPRQGTLDHPTMPSQPPAWLNAFPGKTRDNPPLAAGQPTERVVLSGASTKFVLR